MTGHTLSSAADDELATIKLSLRSFNEALEIICTLGVSPES
jgi:hypothetical protein